MNIYDLIDKLYYVGSKPGYWIFPLEPNRFMTFAI